MSTAASSRPASGGASASGGRTTKSAKRAAGEQEGLVRSVPKAKVRRARLLVTKIDPWSALKLGFLLSVALGIITVVGVIALWSLMDMAGIFNQINDVLGTVLGAESGNYTVQSIAPLGTVVSLATIVAVLNVIVLTLLSAVMAIIYNLSAGLVGGLGLTLTDD
ncbi:DUF3566 domain-containing protein [Micrococcus cohnii]|uniref:Putative membrane protein n=1 Tax=Micrococcus cohnii TaxID=993416 RepID=A0A7W7GQ63_9MICC|nr:DUF3566 domain-containing protein [uncultured Micrococcus sp.]MBB4736273.1 putative membrane protein [Micrococcus cohnii]